MDQIVRFLPVLGLPTERVPTFAEYKSAYKKKKNLHPDKPGNEEKTAEFQEITEAARNILIFMTANPKLQTKPETDEGARLIKSF